MYLWLIEGIITFFVDGGFKSGVCIIFSGKFCFCFFFFLSPILDIEPRVSCILGKYFNTELHPRPIRPF